MPSSDHRLLQLPATFALPDARAAGITPKQRQGRQLLSVSRGLYEQRFRPAPDLVGRCQALARLLPTGAAYSHDTAGALLGLPSVGVGVGVGFVGLGLHVTVPAARPAPRRRGVTTHRSDLEPADVASAHGLALTAPGRIFTDLASRLWLEDLVALGDHLVRSGSASLAELAGRTAAATNHRGVRRLRTALTLIDPRAESVPESVLRVRMISAGLPPPTPQLEVYDADGAFVARLDFGFEPWRLGVEYDGRQHAEPGQFGRDLQRHSRLVAASWRVLRVGREDLARGSDRLLAQLTGLLR